MEDDFVEVELELHNRWFWPRFFVSATYEAPMESEPSRWQRFFAANLKGHGQAHEQAAMLSQRTPRTRPGYPRIAGAVRPLSKEANKASAAVCARLPTVLWHEAAGAGGTSSGCVRAKLESTEGHGWTA